jgi:hypothetical protein
VVRGLWVVILGWEEDGEAEQTLESMFIPRGEVRTSCESWLQTSLPFLDFTKKTQIPKGIIGYFNMITQNFKPSVQGFCD